MEANAFALEEAAMATCALPEVAGDCRALYSWEVCAAQCPVAFPALWLQ